MVCTKAEAAAIAYQSIHEQLGELIPYADRLRLIGDVIEIMHAMSETELAQYIDSQPQTESKVVD